MEKITLQNRYGLKIVGELWKPQITQGLAFVVHGLGGYKEQAANQILAKTLYENQYIVINFDATNSVGESEGKYEDATMQKHYEDLVDVISWSKSQDWYIEPFVLVGSSLGAYAVAQYSEDFSLQVKAVFPFAVVVSGKLSLEAHERFDMVETKKWKESGWNIRESVSKPGLIKRLPWSHMEERLQHDLIPKISNLTMPVLLIAGENDEATPSDHQEIFYNALPTQDKEFHIIKGAPHTFREAEHLNQLRNIFDIWLKKLV